MNKKRIAIVFIGLLTSILGYFFIKGNEYYENNYEYEKIQIENFIVQVNGYLEEESKYIPNGDDPQIIVDLSKIKDKNICGINLKFKEEVDFSNIKVYFGSSLAAFTEDNSSANLTGYGKEFDTKANSVVKYLRIDVNQTFEFGDVELISVKAEVKIEDTHKYVIMLVVNMLIVSAVLLMEKKIKITVDLDIKRIASKVKVLAICFVLQMASLFGALVYYKFIKDIPVNKSNVILLIAFITIAYVTIVIRKSVYKHISAYFFLICMIIGSAGILVQPQIPGVSWDDEIHYGRTVYIAGGADNKIFSTDSLSIRYYDDFIYEKKELTAEGREARYTYLNEHWEENRHKEVTNSYALSVMSVAYIPAAVAINIARGMQFSYIHVYMAGKLANLLCYSIIISLAIKFLKNRGKIILAVLGLVPTSIFMAAGYSYDWWVIAFTMLGYAIILGEIQKDRKITTSKFVVAMIIMVIGIMPKAIYFPLLFPAMLLKKDRYENSKICRVSVIVAIGVLVATFLMPMLISGAGEGDLRGGSGVNSTEQIKFIIKNPFEYVGILTGFLESYLSLDSTAGYLTYVSYLGQGKYYGLIMMCIIVACLIDNNSLKYTTKNRLLVKAGTLAGVLGSVVLAATAMYISFTSVANSTVLGCQPRYILPVVFPLLYCVSEVNAEINNETKNKATMILCMICAVVYIWIMREQCAVFY